MNRRLFQTNSGLLVYANDAINEAGGVAYNLSPKEALAVYACTGCLNNTYYASDKEQLDKVLGLCNEIEDKRFIAKTAVYAREAGMKDMPALMVAHLSTHGLTRTFEPTFRRCIDRGKMLQTFCRILRSGQVGRKSFGTMIKRAIREWFAKRDAMDIFFGTPGGDPSMADIIKMAHPKPRDKEQDALFSYLIGKREIGKMALLPKKLNDYLKFQEYLEGELPSVPFQFLEGLELKPEHWKQMAMKMGWQALRQSLNRFHRRELFKDPEFTKKIADRLGSATEIEKAKPWPYQVYTTSLFCQGLPTSIQNAVAKALEVSLKTVPNYGCKVAVCLDTSSSMHSPVTGRGPAQTKMRCVDVAALFAAALLKSNDTTVIPFDTRAYKVNMATVDSVGTIANRLAQFGGGGTVLSIAMRAILTLPKLPELVIYFSDNESWAGYQGYRGTGVMQYFNALKAKKPNAKLVLVDLQPYSTTQGKAEKDVLTIGGFSDKVFGVIKTFLESSSADHWVREIESVNLE